jgi:hypothetical protein
MIDTTAHSTMKISLNFRHGREWYHGPAALLLVKDPGAGL